MTVCVRLPALFADRISGVNTVDVPTQTVQDALRTLAARYPELRNLVLGPSGEINPMMVLFLNDKQLSSRELACSVRDDDEIEIIPAIEGGLPQDAPPLIQ
jgi:molybdopterin converting factor small subunit